MKRSVAFALLAMTSLSACTTTTSFAPPPTAIQYTGDQGVDFSCPAGGIRRTTITVSRDRVGTYKLIDTFIAAVRCGGHSAANGRQAFQIPAFIATTGAAVAVALGGGANYGIFGTAGNAVANGANNYWDPRQKAAIYDHALDALLCIKTEAVGVDAFAFNMPATSPIKAQVMQLGLAGSVSVPVEHQYFMMVSAAVFSVERVLAHRLSNVGSVDASAVVAEIEKLAKAREEAEADPPTPDDTAANALEAAADAQGDPDVKKNLNAFAVFARKQANAEIGLKTLKPKLDQCIVRAKL